MTSGATDRAGLKLSEDPGLSPIERDGVAYGPLLATLVTMMEVQCAPVAHSTARTRLAQLLRLQDLTKLLASLLILSDKVSNRLVARAGMGLRVFSPLCLPSFVVTGNVRDRKLVCALCACMPQVPPTTPIHSS
jgi:hypothetical protein